MAREDEADLNRIEKLAELEALQSREDELRRQLPTTPPQEWTGEELDREADISEELVHLRTQMLHLFRALRYDDSWPGDVQGSA